MSIRRKLLAIAAATALTVAAAVPAMAFENEFHGMFGLRATTGNYNTGGGTGYLFTQGAFGGTGDSDGVVILNGGTPNQFVYPTHTGSKNWVEQRARIFYSAKTSDDLKLVTAFEIDSTWGKSSYIVGRANEGGALGADSVNLETKWVYLDFNIPKTKINVKAGIQGLNDAYKGLIVGGGADAAGVLVSAPVGPLTLTTGWFRLDDHSAFPAASATPTLPGAPTFSNGKFTRDLLLLDAKLAITKDIKVGGSYYFLNSDNAADVTPGLSVSNINASPDYAIHIFGANAAATFGPLTLDAYGIYEFGQTQVAVSPTAGNGFSPYAHVNAFAGNVSAKLKAGPGTAKVNLLYVSGGSSSATFNAANGQGFNPGNGFISINNTTSAAFSENALGSSFGNMFLLVRNSGNTTNDQYMIYASDNRGLGLYGGSIGYDANITDKLFANVNIGAAWNAKRQADFVNGTTLGTNSTYQGTEANLEVGYKLYDNLTASVQGAYVLLGGWYNHGGIPGFNNGVAPTTPYVFATRPADPYLGRIVLNYTF